MEEESKGKEKRLSEYQEKGKSIFPFRRRAAYMLLRVCGMRIRFLVIKRPVGLF